MTRSQIESYTTTHLDTAHGYWSKAAEDLRSTFDSVHADAQGLDWEGFGGEGLVERTFHDTASAHEAATTMLAMGLAAREGALTLSMLHSSATELIEAARVDGFNVGDDLSVTDSAPSPNAQIRQVRQAQAEAFALGIAEAANALHAHDQLVSVAIQGHSAVLQGQQFADGMSVHPGASPL